VFHKMETPLTQWFRLIRLMGHQERDIFMLWRQRLGEIKSCKTVGTMGHKIRQARVDRDAYY
jgi:hypothetical protein